MTKELLKTSTGDVVYVDRGESAMVRVGFKDLLKVTLDKASIQTLTATLENEADKRKINGRDNQDVLDVNGGTVAVDGTLTLKLSPDDNAICGVASPGAVERHVLTLRWSWTDDDLDQHTGKHQFVIMVLESS